MSIELWIMKLRWVGNRIGIQLYGGSRITNTFSFRYNFYIHNHAQNETVVQRFPPWFSATLLFDDESFLMQPFSSPPKLIS